MKTRQRRGRDVDLAVPTVIDLTDATPDSEWVAELAQWIAARETSQSMDVSNELRGWSRRLGRRGTGPAPRPSAGWLQNLADWIATDDRPEAAEFADGVRAWAAALNEEAARRASRRDSRPTQAVEHRQRRKRPLPRTSRPAAAMPTEVPSAQPPPQPTEAPAEPTPSDPIVKTPRPMAGDAVVPAQPQANLRGVPPAVPSASRRDPGGLSWSTPAAFPDESRPPWRLLRRRSR